MTHEDFFNLMGFTKIEALDSSSVWYEKGNSLLSITIWPPTPKQDYLDFKCFSIQTCSIETEQDVLNIQKVYKKMAEVRLVYKALRDNSVLEALRKEFEHSKKEEK